MMKVLKICKFCTRVNSIYLPIKSVMKTKNTTKFFDNDKIKYKIKHFISKNNQVIFLKQKITTYKEFI